MKYDKEFKKAMYKSMYELRVFEATVQRMYNEGFIPNSAHLYAGEEAIGSGICAACTITAPKTMPRTNTP